MECAKVALVLAACFAATALSLLNPAELARGHGYDAEDFTAQTDDGHLLSVFRIRNASSSVADANKTPVLVMPGLVCNAAIWVLLGPGKALAYLLADRGYDVWLGDYRGLVFSRRHVNLSDQDPAFWDYSMDDLGRLDVPALLQLVLDKSGRRDVAYVGHSMGASMLSIMASERPDLVGRIARAYMLAPAAYMGHATETLMVTGSASAVTSLHMGGFGLFGSGEIPLSSWWAHYTIQGLCSSRLSSPLCLLVSGMYVGHDNDQVNRTAIPFITEYLPDSMSVKNVQHFAQSFGKEREFRRFDYGLVGNMAKYGSVEAPRYNVSRSTFPVSIYYGANDFLVHQQDVLDFAQSLPNVARPPYRIPLDDFNHIDFFVSKDVKMLLYDRLLDDMDEDGRRGR